MEFPRGEYPPNEESKDLILRAFVTAAAEFDTHLVIRATQKKKEASLACITFACDQWRADEPPKTATNIQTNVYKDIGDSEQSISKEGIKSDIFIKRRKAGSVDSIVQALQRVTTDKEDPNQQ